MTPAKPGKTRRGAGRKVVVALSKENPCSESPGLRGKTYWGAVFPHQAFRWGLEPSKARKVAFRRDSASEAEIPRHREQRSPQERGGGGSGGEPGLCFDFKPQM